MAEQSPSVEVKEKKVEWSCTIGVSMPVPSVEVYQRVEKVIPHLLENGVLRVETIIKLFAVANEEKGNNLDRRRVFSKTVEINTYIELQSDIRREDITSIDHHVIIKNFSPRPDKINVVGTLKLKISYMAHLVLDGTVTSFLNGAPLAGATINIKKPEDSSLIATTSTGGNGRYFFKNLPSGIYLVEATGNDYEAEQKVSIVKNRDTVNFVLAKPNP